MGEQIRSTLSKPYALFGVSHFKDMAPVTAEQVTVAASPTLVRQAVENMVGNGLTHGEDPSLAVAQVDRNAEITVESDGPKLDAAEVHTWVEPFARAQRTAGGGQGLGLAIVGEVCRAHRAQIQLDQGELGGLLVRVRFPAE